jgi:phosphatidylserine decarboxylase
MFYAEYFPQKLLTWIIGLLAETKLSVIKNLIIRCFIKLYAVDMSSALIPEPERYASFNDFFIRQLQADLRPIANDRRVWVSPADGQIAQFGDIREGQLIQAKQRHFSLQALLAGDTSRSAAFYAGHYMTIYLAPNNYHRVHMPYAGRLTEMVYVPGRLFPVNQTSALQTADLFSRNERVICYFETDFGPMAVILVGALNVGSISVNWHGQVTPPHHRRIHRWQYDQISLARGAELGYFKLGSTVIVLFPSQRIKFNQSSITAHEVKFGQRLGDVV